MYDDKLKEQAVELDNYARENITDYKNLRANGQASIRAVIRQGRSFGIQEDFILSCARVSARSGLSIVYSMEESFVAANGTYADGAIDIVNNRIIINPEAKSRTGESILIHELTHAIYNTTNGKLKIAKGVETMTNTEKERIRKRYAKVSKGDVAVIADEINAHFAEQTLSNKNILKRLVEKNPNVKKNILDFFKKAKTEYNGDKKLSGASARLYRQYKKLFDEFSMRNQRYLGVENSSAEAREQVASKNNIESIRFSLMNDHSFSDNVKEVLQMSDTEARAAKAADRYVSIMKNTPDIILNNVEGAKDLEVIIRFDALYLASRTDGVLDGNYHALGEEITQRLPQLISDPDAIVRMDNGRLNILAQMKTGKGSNGIISIELNTVKDIDSKYSKYNLVVSAFTAKDNYLRNLLQKRAERIEYIKKDLSQVNHQLHESLAIINGRSNNSISKNSENVNPSETKSDNNKRYVLAETDSNGKQLSSKQYEFFKNTKITDSFGNLLVLYHQTDADFTVFDTLKEGAGTRDNETPHGIFMKPTADDIGLSGSKQMPLYANIQKPLRFMDRTDAQRHWRTNIEGYGEIINQINANDVKYNEQFEEAFNLERVAQRKKVELKNLNKEEQDMLLEESERESDEILDKWETENEILDKQAKKLIDEYLKNTEYDGVILESDRGSMGRRVRSIIALHPNQVKSIDNVNPSSSKDIRFALPETDSDGTKISSQQREYFANSKIKDGKGQLLVTYHGSPNKFFTFDRGRIGRGNDQFGAGFYFAASEDASRHYGENIHKTYLNIQKPIVINRTADGGDLFDVKITQKQAYEILKRHPLIYDSESSPLGDIFEEYWEVGAKDYMIREAAKNLNSIGLLDSDYTAFRNFPNELHDAIRDIIGYDGIEIRFDNSTDRFYVAWFENQIKLTSNTNPTKAKDIRFALPVDRYTEKQYNDYGWVRANEVLTKRQWADFNSKFAKAINGEYFPKTKGGEYIIAVNKRVDAVDGVNNVLVYVRGTMTSPKISKILKIDLYNETELDNIRREIYESERRGIQREAEDIFRYYNSVDFEFYGQREGIKSQSNSERNRFQRGRSSGETTKIKAIHFNDDGSREITYRDGRKETRYALDKTEIVGAKKSNQSYGGYSVGQRAKFSANNTAMRVYTKAEAREVINSIIEERLVFDDKGLYGELSGKDIKEVTDYLFAKLNTVKEGYRGNAALKIADFIIDNTVLTDMINDSSVSEAMSTLSILRRYMHRLDLKGIKGEIENRYDKKNNISLVWGAKEGGYY